MDSGDGWEKNMAGGLLVPGDGFVEIEDDAAEGSPCGEFRGGVFGGRGVADGEETGDVFGAFGVSFACGVEEVEEPAEFFRAWGTAEGFGEGAEDAVGVVIGGGEETGGPDAGGFDEGRVVEEREGLLGRVGGGAEGDAVLAGGGVEVSEHGVKERALPVRVDAAAVLVRALVRGVVAVGELEPGVVACGLIGFDGRAAGGEVEETGDGEGVVADGFGFETARVLGGEPAVERVGFAGGWVWLGGLAIGMAGDDETDHSAEVPVGHEFGGEPVEEFRVGGGFALGAEVVGLGAEAGAEELTPEPVHDDAGGERVLRGNDPVGEVETRERALFIGLGEKAGGEGRGDRAGFVLPVAAGEDADGERVRGTFGDHDLSVAVAGGGDLVVECEDGFGEGGLVEDDE